MQCGFFNTRMLLNGFLLQESEHLVVLSYKFLDLNWD